MDKQGRLTKWEELELGAAYEWVKGRRIDGEKYVLVEINRKGGFVRLRHNDGTIVITFNWQKRYRKIVDSK